jgi:hypothetical protein
MPDETRIAIAGDWGSGTDEAAAVARQIVASEPDYTIHLGDVYYVGNTIEIQENFLGVKTSIYDPVKWPDGKLGSFSLCGNHEMFSNGAAFYDILLPGLKQPTSFFRLENDNWIILGLDTAYNSTGLDFGPFKPSCALPKQIVDWLAASSFPLNKRVIVLTHHQPWSAFETGYPAAARQLSAVLHSPFIWIWGHEHRMAMYEPLTAYGVTASGFCAGHGGMPVTVKKPEADAHCKVNFTDTRIRDSAGMKVGYNGHLQLQFIGRRLLLSFIDMEGAVIYREECN